MKRTSKTVQIDKEALAPNIANMGRKLTAAFNASTKKQNPQTSSQQVWGSGGYRGRGYARGRGRLYYNNQQRNNKKKEVNNEKDKDQNKGNSSYDNTKQKQNFRK